MKLVPGDSCLILDYHKLTWYLFLSLWGVNVLDYSLTGGRQRRLSQEVVWHIAPI